MTKYLTYRWPDDGSQLANNEVVLTTDLVQAVHDAAKEHDLCREGVGEFLDWFGLDHTVELEVEISIPEMHFVVQVPVGFDVAHLDDTLFDSRVDVAVHEMFAEHGIELPYGCMCVSSIVEGGEEDED